MENFELIKKIVSDEELAEIAGDAMTLNFLAEPQPLSEYNDEEYDGDCAFREDGIVFAEDGSGGFYILLEDGSIGYANPSEDECGRPAENLREFLELMLNAAYDWQNYVMEPDLVKNSELVKEYGEKYEKEGRKQIYNVFGNQYPSYEELIKKVGERLDLRVYEDISEDVLPKLFKAVKREPEFAVIMDADYPLETLGRA